jgi:hypothetical protein
MVYPTDPYLAAYLRKPRIPDTVVVPGTGDQRKTLLPPRRRPRGHATGRWNIGGTLRGKITDQDIDTLETISAS